MRIKKKYFVHRWKKKNKVYKDDFKRVLGCPKIMWLMRNRADPQLREWVKQNLLFLDKGEKLEFENVFDGEEVQKNLDILSPIYMKIAGGVWFEELVGQVFSKKYHYFEFPKKGERYTAEQTKKILKNKMWEVFRRPFFEFGNYVTEIDFLKRNGDGFDIYEVKSIMNIKSRKINNNLYIDLCYQAWIMRNAGWNVKNVYLVYMKRNYFFENTPHHENLLEITDEFNRPDLKSKNLENHLIVVRNLLKKSFEEISQWLLNSQCDERKSNYCTHITPIIEGEHLWIHLNNLRRLKKAQMACDFSKKMDNLNLEKINVNDYPGINFTTRQRRQINVIQKKEAELKNKEKAELIFKKYQFPIYFFDFETSQIQIPKFAYTKPYTQIPFQYSIFVLKNSDYNLETKKNIENFYFISENRNDPRKLFISSFLKDIQKFGVGTYVAYNTSFEKMILRNIPERFLSLKQKKLINQIIDEAEDLMDFFRDFNIYLPNFKGSLSLKKTLPAFAPNLNYDELEIKKGDQASNLYFCYIYEKISDEKWKQQIKNLKCYCDLDTWGMVVLYHKIKKMIEIKN